MKFDAEKVRQGLGCLSDTAPLVKACEFYHNEIVNPILEEANTIIKYMAENQAFKDEFIGLKARKWISDYMSPRMNHAE